ncbi:MAG: SH3 domain-containing protein [Proteobacteria bacterium]|nr:SH3 domain-containing protein [Pseudomonadota bacterium]MBU2517515.1 SH3 domain-containing protein [Pseudomonadota bacterium]
MFATRIAGGLLALALMGLLGACAEVGKSVPQEVGAAFKDGQKRYVLTNGLNLRQCPNTECRILAVLRQGDIVLSIGEKKGWSLVEAAASGQKGWVANRYLGANPGQTPPPATAKSPAEPPPLPKEQWGAPGSAPPPVKEQYGK